MGAAEPVDSQRARELVWAEVEGQFDRMREAGVIAPDAGAWHFRVVPAVRAAIGWFRVRRKLARPYESAATTGEHRCDFFVACYEETEQQLAGRAPRPNLKAGLLVGSLALSLALWGVVFDWPRAVALVVVLLVHEFGHAIAMRAFGWKDLSMFFIPFLGAIVTGRPSEVPAWKQVVVLFAGPLPGLIAGIVLLAGLGHGNVSYAGARGIWLDVGLIAVSVNLFNLLPITPLDGGDWSRSRCSAAGQSCEACSAS